MINNLIQYIKSYYSIIFLNRVYDGYYFPGINMFCCNGCILKYALYLILSNVFLNHLKHQGHIGAETTETSAYLIMRVNYNDYGIYWV